MFVISTLFQDLERIKEELTKNFSNICDWFVDNKLSIHFGEDKTKSILFSTKNRKRKIGTLDTEYGDVKIKQYSKVTYLGCELGENLSGEAMASKVMNKINSRLKFLYRKNRYLTPYLKRLLCNALIQPHFDYACSAWYPNLNKKLKSKLQTVQNRCIRYCLQLDNRSEIGVKHLEKINWLLSLKDLIIAFVLTLLIFLRKIALYIFMIYIDNLVKIKQMQDLLF